MHYSCAVITPPDDEPEIVAHHVTRLMSPYQGFHNGAGWWDWYQIGGRWAGSLISEQGIRGDRSLVDDRPDEEVYTTSRHCDAAPIDSIDWDAVGADQVKSLTRLYHSDPIRDLPPNSIDRSMPLAQFLRERMEPWLTWRWLNHDGTTESQKEVYDLWRDEFDKVIRDPDRSVYQRWYRDKQPEVAEHRRVFARDLQKLLGEAPDGYWLTIVDYHS